MYELRGCVQSDLGQYPQALETYRKAVAAEPTLDYARYHIWLLRVRLGERTEATHELEAYFGSLQGSKTTNWQASIYRFLVGRISEKQFLGEAEALIERPAEKPGQVCESYYYAAMKRMSDSDKTGAMELFQRCLDTKQGSYYEFGSAGVELAALKKP
jgi:lipoprotein NlpI